jgi:hypothetical protein
MVWLFLWACGSPPQSETPAADALAPWPTEPEALLLRCASEPFEELAITCRVQAAAQFGIRGDSDRAQSICELLDEGTWRQECHFRAGEELGANGHTVSGLRHCAQAGRFSRNCLTHAGWRMPRDPNLTPMTPPAQIIAGWGELSAQGTAALSGAPDGVDAEGLDVLLAQYGHNVYVGSGRLDPKPARLDVGLTRGADWRLSGALRTGFAFESARLLAIAREPVSVEAIVALWEGQRELSGASVPDHLRLGRFHTPILSPHESSALHLPLFGGGLRLASERPEEDILIAALEALYWLPHTPADVFVPWLDDDREGVRRTAAKLVRITRGVSVDVEALATSLKDRHRDDGVRWHMADALERRSFEEREAGPPPRPLHPATGSPGGR